MVSVSGMMRCTNTCSSSKSPNGPEKRQKMNRLPSILQVLYNTYQLQMATTVSRIIHIAWGKLD